MQHRLSSLTDQIVQAETLVAHPDSNRLFIDARLGDPEEELKSFRDMHIHGAVYAQIREVFAAVPGPLDGNLPLPSIDALQSQLQAWGVDADTDIIVYGPSMALAARGWWVLRWAGLDKVRVLDGGMKAWVAQGGALAQGDAPPRKKPTAPLALSPGHLPQILVSEVEALPDGALLIDARDENSYLAGCIPRARHLAAAEQWTPGSQLRTVAEIRKLYEDAGVKAGDEVVVYCGGGVLSALSALTLQALGMRPRLYVGSWSEWSRDPARMARSAGQRKVA